MPRRPIPLLVAAALALAAFALHHRGARGLPGPWTRHDGFAAQAALLEGADVAADVGAALWRGDRRLVGVMGVGAIVPGVPDLARDYRAYHDGYGFRYVPNTSDCATSTEQGRLQAAAYAYAERYNRLLLARAPPATPALPAPAKPGVGEGQRTGRGD